MSVPRASSRIPGPTPFRKTCTASQIRLKTPFGPPATHMRAWLAGNRSLHGACLLTAIKSDSARSRQERLVLTLARPPILYLSTPMAFQVLRPQTESTLAL